MTLPYHKAWPTLALAVACFGMAGIVWLEWILLDHPTGQEATPPAEASEDATPKVEKIPDFRLHPPGPDAAFVSHPLFIEGRQPIPEVEEPEEASTPPKPPPSPPPTVELIGILDTPETHLVLVRDKQGHILRLHPGEILDGWRLDRIEADQVILSQNGREHTLKLLKPHRPLRPSSRKAVRPAKPPMGNPFNPFLKTKKKSS